MINVDLSLPQIVCIQIPLGVHQKVVEALGSVSEGKPATVKTNLGQVVIELSQSEFLVDSRNTAKLVLELPNKELEYLTQLLRDLINEGSTIHLDYSFESNGADIKPSEIRDVVVETIELASERPFFIVNVEAVIVRGERYLMTVRGAGESHAPGTLSFPGGKVELDEIGDDVLETALRREVREEVGLEVSSIRYLESKSFVADDGERVVDIVFLCKSERGEPTMSDPEEIAEVHWLTAQEVYDHPQTPPWTRQSIEKAEVVRVPKL